MLNSIMKDYLAEEKKPRRRTREYDFLPPVIAESQEALPISPENSQWMIDEEPERLKRIFTFQTLETRNWFISEVIEQEKTTGHYGSIFIDGLEVTVEVHTHDVARVTELDQEYAEFCDNVFQDVAYLESIPNKVKLNVNR